LCSRRTCWPHSTPAIHDSSWAAPQDFARSASIYQQGNIRIADGRLRIGNESLPLANILAATRRRAWRPRRHWAAVMIVSAIVLLAGIRFGNSMVGLGLFAAGAALALFNWFLRRDRIWLIQLNLLLNQRISVMFDKVNDADEFLAALKRAKGGELPTRLQ
jgi:hypothetical protein